MVRTAAMLDPMMRRLIDPPLNAAGAALAIAAASCKRGDLGRLRHRGRRLVALAFQPTGWPWR